MRPSIARRQEQYRGKRQIDVDLTHLLEPLQHVRNEGSSKILRQAPEGRGVFFKECSEILRDFVLLAKEVCRILVENLAVLGGQRDFKADYYQNAGDPPSRGVIGERSRSRREHCAAQCCIGIIAFVVDDVVSRTSV